MPNLLVSSRQTDTLRKADLAALTDGHTRMDLSPVALKIINSSVDAIYKRTTPKDTSSVETAVSHHMMFVQNWSSDIGLPGFDPTEMSVATSVPLRFDVGARRLRIQSKGKDAWADETVRADLKLLKDDRSYLILGEPGSGKTTTLKRLAHALLFPEMMSLDIEQCFVGCPIVVRCRLTSEDNLFLELLRIFGFPKDHFAPAASGKLQSVEHFIYHLLDDLSVCLLVDGLDEMKESLRNQFLQDISSIALHTKSSKVIFSSRSAVIEAIPTGTLSLELQPLRDDDILSIVTAWTDMVDEFMSALSDRAYTDLSSRPLFLTQLLIIFKQTGELPEQSTFVQDRIVHLMLELWDRRNEVRRESRYATMLPEQKKRFLSDLSYFLFYVMDGAKVFSGGDIKTFYNSHCRKFNLPPEQGTQVVTEIESHHGIITRIDEKDFEFSHLSTQEYLAALKLVSMADPGEILSAAKIYQPPLSVAVAISHSSTLFLYSILRSLVQSGLQGENSIKLEPFFSRLALEQPHFEVDIRLAISIMFLLESTSFENEPVSGVMVRRFCEDNFAVRTSIEDFYSFFTKELPESSDDGYSIFTVLKEADLDPFVKTLLAEIDRDHFTISELLSS